MLSTSSVISHTHNSSDKLTREEIQIELKEIQQRLAKQFQSENPTKLDDLLGILEEFTQFELGRFLIKNKVALSGYWTWYVIQGFRDQNNLHPFEQFLIEKAPVIVATRERFNIFQNLLIKHLRSNNTVCSIPCGMMADLLSLKVPHDMNLHFVGIDLDEPVFQLAQDLASALNNPFSCEFLKQDAWSLKHKEEFDLITTNGLNIYEKDDSRVVALYRGLYQALKAGGTLICSALTPPQDWNHGQIDPVNLQIFGDIFKTILQATWANFRSPETTSAQLTEAGFDEIEIYWDSQHMFPTFCAQKSKFKTA